MRLTRRDALLAAASATAAPLLAFARAEAAPQLQLTGFELLPVRATSRGGELGAIVRDDDGRRLHFATAPGEGALALPCQRLAENRSSHCKNWCQSE